MKFTCEVIVNKPRQEVVDLIMDPANLTKWQDGYLGLQHLSGEPGEVGSETKLFYDMGGKEMELLETIQVSNLPQMFQGNYEHVHMSNIMTITFEEIDDHTTRYRSHIDYYKFSGLMPRLMAFLFPGMFKKQTQKWMDQFKVFAESS